LLNLCCCLGATDLMTAPEGMPAGVRMGLEPRPIRRPPDDDEVDTGGGNDFLVGSWLLLEEGCCGESIGGPGETTG